MYQSGKFDLEQLTAPTASNPMWHSVKFDRAFLDTPVVMVMTQTYYGNQTPGLRINNVSAQGFDIRYDELVGSNLPSGTDKKLADQKHTSETIGWVAVGPG